MRLVSSVTAPLRASARPSMFVPVVTWMSVRAMMVPTKVELVPRVAELPICQYTLHGEAPFVRSTRLEDAVVRASGIWNTQTEFGFPPASRIRSPVSPTPEDSGVDAREQRLAVADSRREREVRRLARRVVVRRDQVGLGLKRDGVGGVHGAEHLAGREAGDGRVRVRPEVVADHRGTGVGDSLTRQNGEARGRGQRYGRSDGDCLGGCQDDHRGGDRWRRGPRPSKPDKVRWASRSEGSSASSRGHFLWGPWRAGPSSITRGSLDLVAHITENPRRQRKGGWGEISEN